MSDFESMKATKTSKKFSYQKDLERNAGKKRTYSYEKTAATPRRKKYSLEKDLERAAKQSMKKSKLVWIIVVIAIVVGAVAGFFGIKYAFRNDTYHMNAYSNGQVDIIVGANEDVKTYTELGVKCVSFGKDISSECTVTYYYREDLSHDQVQVDKVDETKGGMYYAVYSAPASRYKTVTLIRNIYVTEVEE